MAPWEFVVRSAKARRLVGPGRLELPTLRLSGVRSNQAELRAYGGAAQAQSAPWARDRAAPGPLARRGERKIGKRNEDGGHSAPVVFLDVSIGP